MNELYLSPKAEMEIKTETYYISYENESETVFFQGSLRLNGTAEYSSISKLLERVIEDSSSKIVLNLRDLEFLNSSGISMLSKFVINVRKRKHLQMKVIGSKTIPWQNKSLKNLQRLMPSLTLELA